LFILSTRPLACGALAQMMSMFEVGQRPGELGDPSGPSRLAFAVNPEDAVLVAVEGNGLRERAVRLKGDISTWAKEDI
jgi:hypothetical protein